MQVLVNCGQFCAYICRYPVYTNVGKSYTFEGDLYNCGWFFSAFEGCLIHLRNFINLSVQHCEQIKSCLSNPYQTLSTAVFSTTLFVTKIIFCA